MAYCKSCAAPLLANTNRCQYCGVRNDVDLNTRHKFSVCQSVSDRICPHCDKPLQTIQIQLTQPMFLERCDVCFGLFFDLDELERLLEHAVNHVHAINKAHIDNINTDRFRHQQAVKYIKCPVCREFMHRANFAQRSGVIIDSCSKHGFWLDSGEVTHLMEWRKAGGQLLHEQEKNKKSFKRKHVPLNSAESVWQPQTTRLETDLFDLLVSVVRKLL